MSFGEHYSKDGQPIQETERNKKFAFTTEETYAKWLYSVKPVAMYKNVVHL